MFKYLYRLPSASVLFSTTRKLTTVCSNPSFSFSIKLCNLRKNKSNFGALFIPKDIQVRVVSLLNIRSMSKSVDSSSDMELVITENKNHELLTAAYDNYGGVTVEIKDPLDCEIFLSLLKASIKEWTQKGKKGVWIKLPIEHVNLVEAAVKEGFWYHHAEPTYLMLVYWIPETVNTLPLNATHRVGVGAFVMSDEGKVLVVQEKSGKLRGSGVWKYPTGVVDEGEDICTAAIREVKEETGIDSEFVEVLAFRQSHKAFFEKSDLFFVCMMRPLSFDIEKQDHEIEAAQWMSFEEYAAQPFIQKNDMFKNIVEICLKKKGSGYYSGFFPVSTKSSFSYRESFLYLNKRDLNRTSNDNEP
ncbi:nudix hydrolase 10-like isoform X1 [Papaver somniferum]|uniref:nudix hydrolase 10-like isoform X1 n=1 Tax=Papaver somniferum TaxID=3469 RepID=UPI000E6F855A|nr:nudix hydrolase 10-like isoform X1 [Papaver somniferum]